MNTVCCFEMHGVRVRIESELAAFTEYARIALAPWEIEDRGRFDIRSVLEWRDGVPPRHGALGHGGYTPVDWTHRPDRDLYVGDGVAHWLRIDDFPDLQVRLAMRGEGIEVTGRHFFHLAMGPRMEGLQRLRHRGDLDALRGRRFSTLLYYLFYHPLLWWLSRGAGWHVLHGGAVTTEVGAVVLAGMPGCGKSTLSVAMLADRKRAMLSDNLVLHDGRSVMACPELLLLDDGSRRLAGPGAERLVPTGEQRVYARDAYRVDEVQMKPQPVAALIHVERARSFRMKPLGEKESAARLRAANRMAKEVRRIAIMAEVLDVVSGARRFDETDAPDRLAASVPSFELHVPPVEDMAAFAEEKVLGEIIRGLGGRRS